MEYSLELMDRIRSVRHRYDMPTFRSSKLFLAVVSVIGPMAFNHRDVVLDLLDVIRQMIIEPDPRDVQIATFLIALDYNAEDIKCACICLAYGGPAFRCVRVKAEDEVAINKLLETKP